MTQYHPNTDILTDYAAGSLAFGQSLCVAVHLEKCAACRSRVASLDVLGAEMMARLEPIPPADDMLEQIFAKLDEPESIAEPVREPAVPAGVPRALAKLIPNGLDAIPWVRVTSSLQNVVLSVGDQHNQVSLVRMKPGGTVYEHGHTGNELTVVLRGGFSDHIGVYRAGDFVALGEGDKHQPLAHQNEDCICLTAQDAPIRFTGVWARLANPLLRVQPQ